MRKSVFVLLLLLEFSSVAGVISFAKYYASGGEKASVRTRIRNRPMTYVGWSVHKTIIIL